MSGSSDSSLEHLEEQFEGVERTLSGLGALDDQQAGRVALRMDRLASQLLAISAPPSMPAVHARLGTTPAGAEDFGLLADQMGPPDREG